MASTTSEPVFIDAATLRSLLSFPSLIHHLRLSLPAASADLRSPLRHSHSLSPSSSLLLMPSWSLSPSLPLLGVKIVTHFPLNSPAVHASYSLFHSSSGRPLASIDGSDLTLWRTSCISALGSTFLARNDAQVLVVVGAGSLAPFLVKAHLTARPSLRKVVIWNRTPEKARSLAEKLREEGEFVGVEFLHGECLEKVVREGDVVSCATNSDRPLVQGAWLKDGAHLDLVGSFRPSMAECDDEAIQRGTVFVDNEAALEEAGELVGAFERGVISNGEIAGSLVELIKGEKAGRSSSEEITVFKSVGSAAVDLLSAQLVYETYMKNRAQSAQ